MDDLKVQPLQSITINVDDREIKLHRSELEEDDMLRHHLSVYDRIRNEILEHEYEGEKLKHAQISLKMQLMQRANKFGNEKYGTNSEGEEDEQ